MIDCSRTENYFAEKQRMTKRYKMYGGGYVCKLECTDCPLSRSNNDSGDMMSCSDLETIYPERAVAIVQKWSNTHPQKTYLSEFLKHYPNAPLGDGGTPTGICPYELGLMGADDCRKDGNCVKCWNQAIEDGEK